VVKNFLGFWKLKIYLALIVVENILFYRFPFLTDFVIFYPHFHETVTGLLLWLAAPNPTSDTSLTVYIFYLQPIGLKNAM
jgi:hypothetical protein